jgi:hypothetical protein
MIVTNTPPLRTGKTAAQENIYYLGSHSLNLAACLFTFKDMLSFKIIFLECYCANKKIRSHFVLSIISCRTHQDRNSFTPLSQHGYVYILTARMLYNVATYTERYLRASETTQIGRNDVRINPR